MTVAVCLLLYAAVVCFTAPRLLPLPTGRGSAPGMSVALWLTVLATVVGSWLVAAGTFAVFVARTRNRPDPQALMACLGVLRGAVTGANGPVVQVALVVVAIMFAGLALTAVARVAGSLRRSSEGNRRHAQSARIIGRRVAGIDGVVLDAPQKLAYCVSGRPGTVVITSAALDCLDRPHLDAVLAHEQAHLAGRHHVLLAVTRALAATFGRVRLFTVAQAEVARLLEMCADDSAAGRHGTAPLLAAIVSLAGGGPLPATALGASSIGVRARVARLTNPDTPGRRRFARLMLAAALVVVVAAPVLIGWAALTGMAPCGLLIA